MRTFLLSLLIPSFLFGAFSEQDRQDLFGRTIISNGGFENGKGSGSGKWTASGGTFAIATSGSNKLIGNASATWDSNGASQTLSLASTVIPNGLAGTSGIAFCTILTPSGSATHTLDVTDGSTTLASATITSFAVPTETFLNFSFPTSGSVVLRLSSVASDEPSITIDGCFLGKNVAVKGAAISDWISFTPTGSWSTNTTYTGQYRQVGDTYEILYKIAVTGAPTTATLTVNLPNSKSFDTTKMNFDDNSQTKVGLGRLRDSGTNSYTIVPVATSSSPGLLTIQYEDDAAAAVAENNNVTQAAPITFASGDAITVRATVPISGLSSNISLASSSRFFISSYLANGSRVTGSDPTALGQYRSYLRNASASTYTETNGSPAAAPSIANGMLLYGGEAFNTADPNNEPSRYRIFVGKNKFVSFWYWSGTGRTGDISTDVGLFGTAVYGVRVSYDHTTGVAEVTKAYSSAGTGSNNCGITPDFATPLANCYFDIEVSDTIQTIAFDVPQDAIWVRTANGYGSTNTKIRRWTTTVRSTGSAITYADSSTLGGSFTINRRGTYCMSYSDQFSSSSSMGITLNTAQPTTNITSLSDPSEVLSAATTAAANQGSSASRCIRLVPGDVVRGHSNGTSSGTSTNFEVFSINRVTE